MWFKKITCADDEVFSVWFSFGFWQLEKIVLGGFGTEV